MMRRVSQYFAIPLVLLLLAGCAASVSTLEISGTTIQALGDNFLAVNSAFRTGCPTGQIKAADCNTFRAFQRKFQQIYPAAAQAWVAAKEANDAVQANNAAAMVTVLTTELVSVAALAGLSLPGGN